MTDDAIPEIDLKLVVTKIESKCRCLTCPRCNRPMKIKWVGTDLTIYKCRCHKVVKAK